MARKGGKARATTRHYVTIIGGTVPRGRCGRPALWAYSYSTVAEMAGVKVESVRKACQARGKRPPALDMADLESVVRYIMRHRCKE
jgi:hypothetical protein